MDEMLFKTIFGAFGALTAVNVLSLLFGSIIVSAFRDIVRHIRHIVEIKKQGTASPASDDD